MISCHSNAMPGGVLCVTGISELAVLYPRVWPDLGGIFHTEEMSCNGEIGAAKVGQSAAIRLRKRANFVSGAQLASERILHSCLIAGYRGLLHGESVIVRIHSISRA